MFWFNLDFFWSCYVYWRAISVNSDRQFDWSSNWVRCIISRPFPCVSHWRLYFFFLVNLRLINRNWFLTDSWFGHLLNPLRWFRVSFHNLSHYDTSVQKPCVLALWFSCLHLCHFFNDNITINISANCLWWLMWAVWDISNTFSQMIHWETWINFWLSHFLDRNWPWRLFSLIHELSLHITVIAI